jgi:hypothetical protein
MSTRDFFLIIFAVAIGSLVGLIAWTLIVKSQLSSTLASSGGTLGTILSLFGSKPAASP